MHFCFNIGHFIVITDKHFLNTTNAKNIIEQYHLHQFALRFQIMLSDANNTLYPTDCCCETIEMTGYTGKLYLEQFKYNVFYLQQERNLNSRILKELSN